MSSEVHFPDWILSPLETGVAKSYSADELINAYLIGKEDQRDAQRRALNEAAKVHISSSKRRCEDLFTALKQEGFGIKTIFLRIPSLDESQALILVEEADLLGDRGDRCYELAESCFGEDSIFNFDYCFLSESDQTNIDAISSNGYTLRYGTIQSDAA